PPGGWLLEHHHPARRFSLRHHSTFEQRPWAVQLGVEPPPRILPEVAGGTVLAGDRLLALVGDLRFPSFEEGYGAMLDARAGGAPPTGRA
ncbi:hypothetical protein ACIQC8_03440, partial [Agrococcus sediminis]|uniref:hypothetical protein n=1 Tax=Agrococcus sediminis TaxID=2599924 RepID=UPI0037FB8E58